MLAKMIMDAMEEYISENADAEKADQKVADKGNKVMEKAKALSEDLHRKVTVEELASETRRSEKYIREAMPLSLEAV
jgi:RNA polymerase primary sigma factor